MTRAWPLIPKVLAMGHVTSGGHWHPGRADGCPKCPPPPTQFAMCEHVFATAFTPIHIRELAPGEQTRLGGGVVATTLCGRELRGWDLPNRVADHVSAASVARETGPTCRGCAAEWRRRQQQQ